MRLWHCTALLYGRLCTAGEKERERLVIILDFVHGEVIELGANPEAVRRLMESVQQQSRKVAVAAGGVPASTEA